MRTEIELLKALKNDLTIDLQFCNGLCGLVHNIAANDEEKKCLEGLIKEMKPTSEVLTGEVLTLNYSNYSNYYWPPGDKLIRYYAIDKLIEIKKKKERVFKLLKSTAVSIGIDHEFCYDKGCLFTESELKQVFPTVINPDLFPSRFKNITEKKKETQKENPVKKYQFLKEYNTPFALIPVGEVMGEEQIKINTGVGTPEKLNKWFKLIEEKNIAMEKTLRDYENELSKFNSIMAVNWLKKFYPKQYYSIILQMIANDLCDFIEVRTYFIVKGRNDDWIVYDNWCRKPIGSIMFGTKENAEQAIEIMGHKLDYLI